MRDPLAGRVCLVTGASSGIGEAATRKLAARDAIVHALGRNAAKLDALARETGCVAHVLDVTDGAELAQIVAAVLPEIFVCNAGTNRAGSLADAEAATVERLIAVNLTATLHLVRLALPVMMTRGVGHIVLVGSIAGHHALTGGNAIYHAAKAGVRALADQLRVDLVGYRIRVTEIAPGRTRTQIFARSLGDRQAAHETFFDGYETMEPEDVADAILFALAAPPRVNVSHIEMTPTLQVIGGLTTVKSADAKASAQDRESAP